MNRFAARAAVGLTAAALAFVASGKLISAGIDAVGADIGAPSIELAVTLRAKLGGLAGLRARTDEPIVVIVGDSTVLNDFLRPEVRKDVGRALARRLGDVQPRPRVRTISTPGLAPASAFWMAPDIIATQPAVVILTANLALLSEWWHYPVPELVRWWPAERWWHPLFLPIHADGLSVDQYLLRSVGARLVSLEDERRLSHQRARARRSRVALELRWLRERAPEIQLMDAHQRRRLAYQGEDRYSGALRGVASDHPHLAMLTALVEEFESEGIPVIVYVPPVSPTYFRDGTNLAARFARSLEAVREASGSADFHDLHAALPESAFRDWQDHYTTDGDDSGMDQMAALLEGPVRKALAGSD